MGAAEKWIGKAEQRVAKAIRWRADAMESDPSLKNLFRPKPGLAQQTHARRSAENRNHSQSTGSNSFKKQKGHQQRYEWGAAFYDEPVRENFVFYESFSGNGALCNPRAIFDFLINDPSFADYEHVWALRNGEGRTAFESEFARLPNVHTVTHGSTEYWQQLSTSKYLVNNSTFPWKFSKRREQIYVNTWHGTPLKTMGYDSNEGAYGAANILRNFTQADYLISPNEFTTSAMYSQAYKLEGLFEGKILEYGYPRIDAQFASEDTKAATRRYLRTVGIALEESTPVVLYAPTWRGIDFQSAESSAKRFEELLEGFKARFGDRAVLLFKVHQQVYDLERNNEAIAHHIVPNSMKANDLLAITDVLVSDYSSIWVDYLASGCPMVFYTPDKAVYESTRGTYFDERPGVETSTLLGLLDEVETVLFGNNVQQEFEGYQRIQQRLTSLEDGHSTEALVNEVFRSEHRRVAGANRRVVEVGGHDKIRILLYLGGMRRNGITTSGLNLINTLDPEKYDISIWAPRQGKNSDLDMYARIPAHVRQFLRHDSHPLKWEDDLHLKEYLNDGDVDNHVLPDNLSRVFDAEWRRCFGDSVFDYIVDFSGYAGFWSLILAHGPCTRGRFVWAHNDLESDRRKIVNGEHPNDAALVSQYKAYQFFDGLVSVSSDLSDVNARSLWPYVKPNGFFSVRNSLDLARLDRTLSGGDRLRLDVDDEGRVAFRDVLRELAASDSNMDIGEAVKRLKSEDEVFSADDVYHFISVGRLAPEKNQERLLRAFAMCYESEPRVRLTLLGEGPLRKHLEALAAELDIREVVNFMGNQPEALSYMRRADTFVLSSDFEGQPMVFMESLSMGTPVLSVNFPTVGAALPEGQGHVVASTAEALAEGMLEFVRGEISIDVTFSAAAYNEAVVAEFEEVLGVNRD